MMDACKNLTYTDTSVSILGSLNEKNVEELKVLARELSKEA